MEQRTEETTLAARTELRRAYLHLSYGDIDAALEACARARTLAPEQAAPRLIEGATLTAAGRLRDAVGVLRAATQRWPDEPLGHVYFAEACWLMGRARQASQALERAERLDTPGDLAPYIADLRAAWAAVGEAPAPVRISAGPG